MLSPEWWNSVFSFVLGATTVGLFWFWQQWQQKNLNFDSLRFDDLDNMSWVEPWSNVLHGVAEDFSNRIGELRGTVTRRSRWPWETIRKRLSVTTINIDNENIVTRGEDDNDNILRQSHRQDNMSSEISLLDDDDADFVNDHGIEKPKNRQDLNKVNTIDNNSNHSQDSSIPPSPANKQICIGSIFGLDVGGTLAKLVYFEQKQLEYDPISPRERHYAVAASAQAVMMARNVLNQTDVNDDPRDDYSNPAIASDNNKGVIRRRRSFSVGCLGRTRQLQEERRQERQQQNQNQPRSRTQSAMHSKASELDLRHLNALRQESVPDDLNHYRTSVHFNGESNPVQKDHEIIDNHSDNNEGSTNTMKKSRSMFDLSQSQKKAQALDHFYSFARRLDSYHGSDHKLSFYSRELGGEFHFIHFETRKMQNAMDLIRAHNLHAHIAQMGATGGGAHKFATLWEKQMGIAMDKQNELNSLVAGMQFVLSTVVGECYTFRPKKKRSDNDKEPATRMSSYSSSESSEIPNNQVGAPMEEDSLSESEESISKNNNTNQINSGDKIPPTPKTKSSDEWWWSRKVQRDAISYSSAYPYMLVTIGTGVSILRVDGPRQHERISGSTIGGGTYWGLIRLLTDVEDFDDVMRLAEKGDPSKVDMMVGDIYGNNSDALQKLGLPSHIVASSFGKLVAKADPAEGLKQEDLARALLLMVTNNIGQVAYLNAKLHKTPRIYFVGNFLRRNIISQRRLSYAIHYWSKGEMEALFLEHEGYFGALGAFILSQKISHSEAGFFQWKNNNQRSNTNRNTNDDDHDDDYEDDLLADEQIASRRVAASGKVHRRMETFGT